MNGAIFFSGQYGSTAQYAHWISETTGLPVFDINGENANPSEYDFLILGSSVIVEKLTIKKWVSRNLTRIQNKPIILFTVSGAPAGSKLNSWIASSLPSELISKIQHVALRGRMDPGKLSWRLRLFLKVLALMPKAKKQELEGFDYMDKSGISPINRLVQEFHTA